MAFIRLDRCVPAMAAAGMLACGPLFAAEAGDRPRGADLVDEVMAHLGFDAAEKRDLLAGEILFTGRSDLEPMPHALAVAGAMLFVRRQWTDVIESYLSEDTLRVNARLLAFGEVPAKGGDAGVLAALQFEPTEATEVRRLLRARPGTGLNLSPAEIERFRAIEPGDDATGEAERVYREVLWARIESYRRAGLAGIAPYARKSGVEAAPAEEMMSSLDSARLLKRFFPLFHDALTSYPDGVAPLSEDRILWTKKEVSDRPMVALVHRLVLIEDDVAIAAEREFYAGHSYNSMLTVVGTAPYGNDTIVFAATRVFSHKAAGGSMRKSLGRRLVGKRFAERFERLRAMLEADSPR